MPRCRSPSSAKRAGWRSRSAAWGPGLCAIRRGVRCRRAGSSTGGTRRWTSGPPRSRRPVRSRTARRRAGRSGGSAPAPSAATAALRPGPAFGAPFPRPRRTGTGAACTAAPAARARCHLRPTGSTGPGPAWSPRGPGSTPGPDERSAPAGPRPPPAPHPRPPQKTNPCAPRPHRHRPPAPGPARGSCTTAAPGQAFRPAWPRSAATRLGRSRKERPGKR